MQNKGIVTKVNCGTTVYFNAQSLHPVFEHDRVSMMARVMKLSTMYKQQTSIELVVSWSSCFFKFVCGMAKDRIKNAMKDRWVPAEEGNKLKLATGRFFARLRRALART